MPVTKKMSQEHGVQLQVIITSVKRSEKQLPSEMFAT